MTHVTRGVAPNSKLKLSPKEGQILDIADVNNNLYYFFDKCS